MTQEAFAYSPDRFGVCLGFTWRPDFDGQALHTTPGDHGGPTAWGVTLLEFQSYCAKHKLAAADEAALGRASRDLLAGIIRLDYWNAVQADRLPMGVDLLVYDFGFGSGPQTSARVLQEVLNTMGCKLEADGQIGNLSIQATTRVSRASLIQRLAARHEAFYRSLGQPVFLAGWLRRNTARAKLAAAT